MDSTTKREQGRSLGTVNPMPYWYRMTLSVDHDIIVVLWEDLKGPSGRQTKRGMFMENNFCTAKSPRWRFQIFITIPLTLL